MPCNLTQADLLDLVNHETSVLRSWTIRRHLAACPECATELTALQEFQTTLRRADLVPPETATPPLRLPAPRRRAYAAASAAALIGSLFLYPALHPSRPNVQNPGAAIAAALGRVNTWHFVGWKQINGKHVPWEIWGRRKPFLYYERVGDTVTWDDGTLHLRVFPPSPALNRPVGLVIKNAAATPERADADFQADPAYQCLVSDSQTPVNFSSDIRLYAQTSSAAKYRYQNYRGMSGINENKLYTISKRDWLPVTYQLHFENPKVSRDTEYLHVSYGGDLPDAILTPPIPAGYSLVDFTQPEKAPLAPNSFFAKSHGFRVQATCAGMDKEGNVLIVVRGWLGGNPLTSSSTFSLGIGPESGTSVGKQQGQTIKYVYGSDSSFPTAETIYLPYAPLEPAQVAGALPDTFHLSFPASPRIQVRSSDQIEEDGTSYPETTTEDLDNETFQWQLSLPAHPVPSLLALLPPDQLPRFVASAGITQEMAAPFPTRSFEYKLAEQRRVYYYLGFDYEFTALKEAAPHLAAAGIMNPDGTLGTRNADGSWTENEKTLEEVEAVRKRHPEIYKEAEQKFRARAAYWQQRKLDLLPRTGSTHEIRNGLFERRLNELSLLAECYQRAGNMAGRNRVLGQLIHECGSLPQKADNVRQAQYVLRTGQFPGDADYKGPP